MPTDESPCSGEEYRQFDFWIGDWEVLDEAGTPQGTNRIEQILGGCALQENWVGAEGSTGHSFNTFDKNSGRWHQTWVDGNGLLLLLDGGLEEGSMVLSGPGVSRDGDPITHPSLGHRSTTAGYASTGKSPKTAGTGTMSSTATTPESSRRTR